MAMKSRSVIAILLILLALLGIVSFIRQTYSVASDNFLSKDLICEFPCWQKVIPQETTFDDALAKLQGLNLVKFADQKEIDFQVNDVSGSINKSSDGKVGFIVLSVKNQATRLSDVVQRIGAPEKILMDNVPYPLEECYMFLMFPNNGTVVELYLRNKNGDQSCRVNITPESRVFRIVLLGYDLYNNEYWKRSFDGSEFIDWNGYGTYIR